MVSRFVTEFYGVVADWADWATGMVSDWPDDPGQARPDQQALEETARRADW